MSLLTKRLAARETAVQAGGHTFTVRRPTDEEMAIAGAENVTAVAMIKRHVVAWNLTELDLIPGGSAVPAEFDAALFADWLADNPDTWLPLSEAILNAWQAHVAQREASAKN